jgi:hypothetical protein
MSSFVDIAKIDEISTENMKAFVIKGKHIIVINNDGVTSW